MPRTYHYPSREQRAQRALIATAHAQAVQTTSQVAATATALTDLQTAVGGDLSTLATTISEVSTLADDLRGRVEALEAAV